MKLLVVIIRLAVIPYLEDFLDSSSDGVMLISDDVSVHNTRGRIEGIHGGVDSQLSNTTRQDGGGVKMRESGGRGRISQIVSGHVDGLDGGDGSLLGGGNSLLHATHVGGESWLVTHSGGDTSQKGRHFGTGLKETRV